MIPETLQKHTEKMKSATNKLYPPVIKRHNVTVPIIDVDGDDLRNIINVVLGINIKGLYKVGTKYRLL